MTAEKSKTENGKTVRFELLASIERQAGCHFVDVQLSEQQLTIADALAQLQKNMPALHDAIERCACAVGDVIVKKQTSLPIDQPIVLLPPVSGG